MLKKQGLITGMNFACYILESLVNYKIRIRQYFRRYKNLNNKKVIRNIKDILLIRFIANILLCKD